MPSLGAPVGKRRRAFPELMGTTEVAQTLGIKAQNLSGRNVPVGMPEPVAHLRATRVWLADDVRAFAAELAARREARATRH